MRGLRKLQIVAAGLALAACLGAQPASPQSAAPNGSGLPVPRYVSLKSDRVNVRKGPGTDFPVAWVFQRVGLPVEIVKEFETWRQVRDSEGAEGWVQQNLLSGRRTALVAPWDLKARKAADGSAPTTPLHDGASKGSGVAALIEPGVLANVLSCEAGWCRVSIAEQRGYIEQARLFGVYPDEAVR